MANLERSIRGTRARTNKEQHYITHMGGDKDPLHYHSPTPHHTNNHQPHQQHQQHPLYKPPATVEVTTSHPLLPPATPMAHESYHELVHIHTHNIHKHQQKQTTDTEARGDDHTDINKR